jgi:hypothetical protein
MSRRANTGSDLLSVIKVAEKKGREAIASSPILVDENGTPRESYVPCAVRRFCSLSGQKAS